MFPTSAQAPAGGPTVPVSSSQGGVQGTGFPKGPRHDWDQATELSLLNSLLPSRAVRSQSWKAALDSDFFLLHLFCITWGPGFCSLSLHLTVPG